MTPRKPQKDPSKKLSGFPSFVAQDSKVYYSYFRPTCKSLDKEDRALFIKHLAKAREKKEDERNIALTRCFFYA